MNLFDYRGDELYCEGVPLARIAGEVGTPAYVYSAGTLTSHYRAFDAPFAGVDHLTCYSVKANANLAVIRLFAALGSGVDIVSGGELHRALRAGVDPKKIVFSGVGKTRAEMAQALKAGILMFNVESHDELCALDETARSLGAVAPISLRVNPDVDPVTHPYLATGLRKSKFGIPIARAFDEYLFAKTLSGIAIVGIDCHIGSQLTATAPFVDAIRKVSAFVGRLAGAGIPIRYLDVGGGLGITYRDEAPPSPDQYGAAIRKALDGDRKSVV
jgi:diaminopimelate decarboxylase